MRNACYLLVTGVTLYVAGAYQSEAVAFLFIAEVLLYFFMLLTAWYLRLRTEYRIITSGVTACCHDELPFALETINDSFLPVFFRADARFYYQYEDNRKETLRLEGVTDEVGTSRVNFTARADHCGFLFLDINSFRIQDFLGLFRLQKNKKDSSVRIAVLPRELTMQMQISGYPEDDRDRERTMQILPDFFNEQDVRQYREYQSGDSLKHIYWNLSAKMDDPWVKEYNRTEDDRIVFFLDLFTENTPERSRFDAFYQIVSSMFLGLLLHYRGILVCWYDFEHFGITSHTYTHPEERTSLFTVLYQAKVCPEGIMTRERYQIETEPYQGEHMLRLDMELCLFSGTTLLHQFSEKRCEQEIEEGGVMIL